MDAGLCYYLLKQSVRDETMEQVPQELDDRVDKLVGKISLWGAVLLAALGTWMYYDNTPPDTEKMAQMRLFFKNNAIEVGDFLLLPIEEQEVAADQKKHPFYRTYLKASENKKGKIRKIYHESIDYTLYQYWFNLVALWFILFSTLWFFGLMAQGVVNLVRQQDPSPE